MSIAVVCRGLLFAWGVFFAITINSRRVLPPWQRAMGFTCGVLMAAMAVSA